MSEVRYKFRVWKIVQNQGMFYPKETQHKDGFLSFIGLPFVMLSKAEGDILMQYTGLKDIKGKEIYEGDILKMDGGTNEETICTVDWVDGGFVLVGDGYNGENLGVQTRDGMFGEIIGNIYKNPEAIIG